ncbi:MAG: coproporphyrinogen dehydrogenase HemZ [Eubacteriales bacterium]|jgi:oxygen-independent coproporphyrinogen-3 oxidase|nr:coproporphyrinogen dehydrogenase HemZ [Clostridiales bacterium]
MKLITEGNVNKYYAQTLCLLFFPTAKFSESEPVTPSTPVVKMTLTEVESGVRATAKIKTEAGESYAEVFMQYEDSGALSRRRTDNIALGAAMLDAGRKLFGITPAWGLLTGVRPAKIAKEYIERGLDDKSTTRELAANYLINPKKAALLTTIARNEYNIAKTLDDDMCSVYISIPFCPTRCAYCSFVSYSTKRLLSLIPDYLERLYRDIDDMFALIGELGLRVVTVYIGGGTPTILTADQLSALLERIARHVDQASLRELTLEAGRPDTITAEKIAVANNCGVSRISINPQTLNNAILEGIGRRHTAEDFYRAFSLAREGGIKTINCDLIAGLPSERFSSYSRSVDAVLKLRPENVTFHTFCVKKSADLIRDCTELYLRNGGETSKSVDYSQLKAKNAGYVPYYIYRQKNTVGNLENVGFALRGHEGLYNIIMMEELHSVFAAGAGGITKLVPRNGSRIQRVAVPKYPYEYLAMDKDPEAMNSLYDKIRKFYQENF